MSLDRVRAAIGANARALARDLHDCAHGRDDETILLPRRDVQELARSLVAVWDVVMPKPDVRAEVAAIKADLPDAVTAADNDTVTKHRAEG